MLFPDNLDQKPIILFIGSSYIFKMLMSKYWIPESLHRFLITDRVFMSRISNFFNLIFEDQLKSPKRLKTSNISKSESLSWVNTLSRVAVIAISFAYLILILLLVNSVKLFAIPCQGCIWSLTMVITSSSVLWFYSKQISLFLLYFLSEDPVWWKGSRGRPLATIEETSSSYGLG